MQQRGMPLTEPDGYIAATALFHELPLATRNMKDFAHLGVTLINPWED
jgi:predicted nucleic acid-binding protein